MRRTGFVALVSACSIATVFMLAGCGDSSSSAPSEAQLEAAKREGEEAARERDRVRNLQKQVRDLKHRANHQGTTVVVEHDSGTEVDASGDSGYEVLRTFHAPSGNVSCEILSDGALCSVSSIATTFAFNGGQAARIESATPLPRGSGELAPYGSTVSAGSITCTVPLASEPHGIICVDSDSGHGFEASRVSERQHAY